MSSAYGVPSLHVDTPGGLPDVNYEIGGTLDGVSVVFRCCTGRGAGRDPGDADRR
jgi:hypothetical protein